MKRINQNQLTSIIGGVDPLGFPIVLNICKTDKTLNPGGLTTGDNVLTGLNTVLTGQGAANGFKEGIDVGIDIYGVFIPLGSNLCPQNI